MKKKPAVIIIICFLIGVMVSCEALLPPGPKDEDVLAGTIPGLTEQQELEHLKIGRAHV